MRRFAVALVVLSLLAAAPASAMIRPQKGMSGVTLGMTKAQVRAKLGSPIGSGGGRLYFARVWVGFRLGRTVEITTTRSSEHTGSGRRLIRGRGPARFPVGHVLRQRRLPQVPARERPAGHPGDGLPDRPRARPAGHDLAAARLETSRLLK
jgi:hypothetical protein